MGARFANRYLEIRAKVADLVGDMEALAESSLTPVEGLAEVRKQLRKKLTISIFGDTGSGRSVFLNSICGKNVSSKLKKTAWSAAYFKNTNEGLELDIPVGYLEAPELSDLLCVRAPSCESLTTDDSKKVEHWVNHSDLIFWIISGDNPWSNTTWGLLDQQPKEVLERSVLVLTKVDEHEADDLTVMMGHLASLVDQRLCIPMDILPLGKGEEYAACFTAIWQRSEKILTYSPKNNHYLDQSRDKLHRVLELIEETLDKRVVELENDRGFLASIEADIARQREREIQLYSGTGVNLGQEFTNQIDGAKRDIINDCGVVDSTLDLFGKGILATRMEMTFIDRVAQSFMKRSRMDCTQILYDCREQWRSKRRHLDERLGDSAGEFQQEPFKKLIDEIEVRQEKSARVAVIGMKLRPILESFLVTRRMQLKRIMMVILGLLILAGLLGAFQILSGNWLAFLALGLAGIATCYYIILVYITRTKVADGMAERLTEMRSHFSEDVYDDYQDMICLFFTGYAPMFESMRLKIVNAKENLEPIQKQHHDLFLKLADLENQYGLKE